MKACAVIVGGFLAVPVVCRLAHGFDVPALAAVTAVTAVLGFMAWACTSESCAIAQDAFDAMHDIGLKQDAAAAMLHITPSQLSAWKVGREELKLQRMLAVLGPEYRVAYCRRALKRDGVEVPDTSIAEMVANVVRAELRALILSPRRMAS